MQFVKKYWYLLVITVITVGLAVMVFLTSQKLTTTQPVAPTVPQATPKAAEPACIVEFSIAAPSPTPTPPTLACGDSCGTGVTGQCPNDHTCSNGKCVLNACLVAGALCNDTKCATLTPSPTPTPGSCNNGCSSNSNCASGYVCSGGACRNPSCTNEADCTCQVSCNNSCATNSDCESNLICSGGSCRNPSCTNKTNCTCDVVVAAPTPTSPPALASCNNTCSVTTDCAAGLVCNEGACRNPSCVEQTNCACAIPTTPPRQPEIPVAGTGPSVLGASVIGGGLLLLLLGLLLPL